MPESLDPNNTPGVGPQTPSQQSGSRQQGAGMGRRISETDSDSPFQYQARQLNATATPSIDKRAVKSGQGKLAKLGGMALSGAKALLVGMPKWTFTTLPLMGFNALSSAEKHTGGFARKGILKAVNAGLHLKGESLVKAVTSKMGIELLHHNQQTQRNLEDLLHNFLQNYALQRILPAGNTFDFPEIIKKLRGGKKLSIQNLKFEVEPILEPTSGILTGKGTLNNYFRIKNLHCRIELPVEGADKPLSISVGIQDAKLTVSTKLSLTRAAWEFKQGKKTTFKDATAIQLEAEKVNVHYDAVASYQEVPGTSKGQKKYFYSFDKGMVTFKDLKASAPVNLFKKEDCQNAYMTFRELHHTSFQDTEHPSVVELPEIAVCHSDNKNNGKVKAKVVLNPANLKGFKFKVPIVKWTVPLGTILSYLCPSPVTISVDCPMVEGEVRLIDLKHSLTITGPLLVRRAIGWLINHPATKILGTETRPKIQLRGHKRLTFPIPMPLVGLHSACKPGDPQAMTDRKDGYIAAPSYLSKFCSRCVGFIKGSHFPITVVSTELEAAAEKAANGDKTACEQLFQAAVHFDDIGHKYETRAALLAIPTPELVEIAQRMTNDKDWQWLMTQVQALHFHDNTKATRLFAQLLKHKSIHAEAPNIDNPELLMTLAQSLLKEAYPKIEMVIQILEYAHLLDPEKAKKALSSLVELHNKGKYPQDRFAKFAQQHLDNSPYFQIPDNRAVLLDVMLRYTPQVVEQDLPNYPIGDLPARLAKRDMDASNTFDLLCALIKTSKFYSSGIDLILKLKGKEVAIELLDSGVADDAPEAISKRAELVTHYKGLGRHTVNSEIQQLIRRLEDPGSTPQVIEAAAMSLGTLVKDEDIDIASLFTRDLQFENEEARQIVAQLKRQLLRVSGLNISEYTNPMMLQNFVLQQLAHPLAALQKRISEADVNETTRRRLLSRTEAALRVTQYLNDYLNPLANAAEDLDIQLPTPLPTETDNQQQATGQQPQAPVQQTNTATTAGSGSPTTTPAANAPVPVTPAVAPSTAVTQPPLAVQGTQPSPANQTAAYEPELCDQLLSMAEKAPELRQALRKQRLKKQGYSFQRASILAQLSR